MLERNPALTPRELRAILTGTARDLGSPGRDDLFGAGEAAGALAAVKATAEVPSPVAVSAESKVTNKGRAKTGKNASQPKELPAIRSLDPPVATVASEKSGFRDGSRPAGR